MSITQPIPEEAYPAIKNLVDANVKIPPASHWYRSLSCFRLSKDGKCMCPLGLHPDAIMGVPHGAGDFRAPDEWGQISIMTFATWWDTQRDTAAAVKELRRVMRLLRVKP